jgi:glycosyltransferase involved in cell wall biosynthesis
VLATHHNPSRFIDLPTVDPLSRRDIALALWLEQRSLSSIDQVLPPCGYMEGVFRSSHRFSGRVDRAPYIINEDYLEPIRPLDPRPSLGLEADVPLVYIPAGGNRFKGSAFVPEIVGRLHAAAAGRIGFFISGVVPAELLAALGPAKVHAPGHLTGEEVVARVKTCSFGVFATLVENYSVALLEAVLSGVPMSVFDVGGNKEIVAHGDTGFVAPYRDVETLTANARQLLDEPFRAAMAARCLADARARHSEPAVAPLWAKALAV